MIQIKKNEKSLRAQENKGKEPPKGIRVYDGIKCETHYGSRSQIIARKDVGLPGRMCMKSIGPSG
jgi:hypothetical protein